MYPFPPPERLQFLVGLKVGQICLDPWSTQVRFENGGQITIEGRFEHTDVEGQLHGHQEGETQDLGPVFLRELVQQTVKTIDSDAYSLTLIFGNGAKLRMWSDQGSFENGQIYPPNAGRDPIVF